MPTFCATTPPSSRGHNARSSRHASTGADAALNAGAALREDLERQRQTFASMVARMDAVGERVPGINRLIGQIRRKKKRDVMVMALVVATLVFLTGLWKLA